MPRLERGQGKSEWKEVPFSDEYAQRLMPYSRKIKINPKKVIVNKKKKVKIISSRTSIADFLFEFGLPYGSERL